MSSRPIIDQRLQVWGVKPGAAPQKIGEFDRIEIDTEDAPLGSFDRPVMITGIRSDPPSSMLVNYLAELGDTPMLFPVTSDDGKPRKKLVLQNGMSAGLDSFSIDDALKAMEDLPSPPKECFIVTTDPIVPGDDMEHTWAIVRPALDQPPQLVFQVTTLADDEAKIADLFHRNIDDEKANK
jgi:hypothetical protein